ncbi:MAG: DUF362 domain-containing protein, partial [bacterium]|nr:DUF362 domain-containing protein [bacterium]
LLNSDYWSTHNIKCYEPVDSFYLSIVHFSLFVFHLLTKEISMSEISVIRCSAYQPTEVAKAIREAVNLIGGMGRFVKKGMRVLLKPNLLSDKPPDKAVNTHPSIIKAVIDLVIEQGGILRIGDNPGIHSLTKIVQKSGLGEFINDADMFLPDFSRYVLSQTPKDYTFREFKIAEEVLEADLVINLPKIKTHGHMLLTLAVKNLFGCLSKHERIQWHLKAGINKDFFATMLLELYSLIQPGLTIVDGVIGMEGNGPGSGTPRGIGVIIAGIDCLSIDTVISHILNLDSQNLYTIKAAEGRNLGKISLGEIDVVGEKISHLTINKFQLPPALKEDNAWGFYIPKVIRTTLKHNLIPKPHIDSSKCNLCHICLNHCPATAISTDERRLSIDFIKCIRCFCCQEFCPQGAITIKESWICKNNPLRLIDAIKI